MNRITPLGLAVVALAACGTPSGDRTSSSADVTATTYVDALDYWKTAADQDAWLAMRRKLEAEFDSVCPDTFCSGDYSNLASLGFTCSVTSMRGSVHECLWAFTGSSHLVNRSTGTVETSIASFQCRIGLKTSARALLNLLGPEGADPSIRRLLPGTTQSLYDVLADCFQHPIGATPISSGTGTTYSDAMDSAGTDAGLFYDAESALKTDFDAVCGDTFCEGDYSNLQALRLACSARATTGTLRNCKWLFGGSFNDIDPPTGAITVHAGSYRCTLPVQGSATELATLLLAPGEPTPINRPLPGSTKTAYDVLVGCL